MYESLAFPKATILNELKLLETRSKNHSEGASEYLSNGMLVIVQQIERTRCYMESNTTEHHEDHQKENDPHQVVESFWLHFYSHARSLRSPGYR